MVSIQCDVKNFYVVKLETLSTEVSGLHLTHERAAELGFEEITGFADKIESTLYLETAGRWRVYSIRWATEPHEPFGIGERRFARVYVRKIEAAKDEDNRPALSLAFA